VITLHPQHGAQIRLKKLWPWCSCSLAVAAAPFFFLMKMAAAPTLLLNTPSVPTVSTDHASMLNVRTSYNLYRGK
jgi:hypothetical protein